jgi:hypothetical protein
VTEWKMLKEILERKDQQLLLQHVAPQGSNTFKIFDRVT